MKKIPFILMVSSFLFSSAGLAFFFTLHSQASKFTILDHYYRFPPLVFLLSLAVSFTLLSLSWILLAKLDAKFFKVKLPTSLEENFLSYLPFLFFLFTPFLLQYYLDQQDLKLRLNLLAVLILFSFIYLKLAQLNRQVKWKELFEKGIAKFGSLPLKKKLIILFAVAFVIYNLCSYILISKGVSFGGDEPYYLLTTHSLYTDKDINVANNYKNKDYFHFYPEELYPNLKLGIYARIGRKGTDYVYPVNQPGISVLILPYYWLSQFFKGKTLLFILKGSLSIWAVLLGLQLYLLLRELWKNERLALLLWFFYSFSVPILFYSIHLYPEIPIALFSVYLFRKVRLKHTLSLLQYVFLGFILSLFLWFGLKYNMIFWPFLLVSVYFLWKDQKARWRILCFLAFPLLSLFLFYFYLYELYGTLNPIAIYEGVITPDKMGAFREAVFKTPVLLRVDSFLDYFLDQRDGLLLYSPLFFFTFLGLVEIFRRAKKDLFLLLFLFLPFVLNYAFFTHRQGYSPPGRILTPLSWIGVILVSYFLVYNRKKLYSFLFWLSCLVGLVIVVLLLQNPSFLYQPTTHEFTFRGGDLFISLSNLYFHLPSLLPSFIKVNNVGYLPNYVWLILVGIFIVGYLLKKEYAQPAKSAFQFSFALGSLLLLFFWFALFPRLVLLFPKNIAYPTGEKIILYSHSRAAQMREPGKFYLSEADRFYSFYFTSWRKIQKIKIELGSLEGDYQVELRIFDELLFRGKTTKEIKTLVSSSPPLYRLKSKYLYSLRLDLKNISEVSTVRYPYFFAIQPLK